MTDVPDHWPHVRHRQCPGCKEDLERFHLTAVPMPIEQFTLGPLQTVNQQLSWSIRPFGTSSLQELQLLAFNAVCANCTLISTWDFGVEELAEILGPHGAPPHAQIAWNYAPDLIRMKILSAPDWLKPHLQQLLAIIAPQKNDGQP